MAILKLNSEIVDNETKVWYAWNGLDGITFEDVKKFISEIPEDDKDILIQINCAGGNCVEGWAMYDALRQSGKNISALIEGQCSSMASVVLLAAPKENRKAYANAHLCIHNPETCWLNVDYYTRLTADNIDAMTAKMQLQAQSLREEQQKVLNLYVERTGTDADTLQQLMNDDVFVNMDKAKELGFISDTLAPNTAHKRDYFNSLIKPNKMAKSNDNKSAITKAFAALGVDLGITAEEPAKMQSLKITCPNGDELTVEREDGEPQVGDAASPDGEFVTDDGTKIVVKDGVITEITKENDDTKAVITNPSTGEELTEEQAQELINELAAKVAELEEKLAAATDEQAKKDEQIASLQSTQISAEQSEILAAVANQGGKEWLAAVTSSTLANGFHKGNNNNPNFKGTEEPIAKIGAGFLKAHTEMRFGKAATQE